MNSLLVAIPAVACVAFVDAEPRQAVRGLASSVEIDYAPRLRARSDQTPASRVIVRVSPANIPSRQRIEFIGAVAGVFDLREFLEREDGQSLADLSAIPVEVVSKLPADHGVDLYATSGSWMNWRAHYREIMWGAVAFWAAVPLAVLVVRIARRPRATPPAPVAPPPPTVAEQLRAALLTARDRPLTVEESGQLELLLFRYLSGESGGNDSASGLDLATFLRDVRSRADTAPLVLAVERWLHAKGSGESARTHAAGVLEELRRSRLATPAPQPKPREATA